MKERPILFNAEMVRAILDGRKTQTRRVLKKQPPVSDNPIMPLYQYEPTPKVTEVTFHEVVEDGIPHCPSISRHKSPFGKIGDRLWVRETFCMGIIEEHDASEPGDRYLYVDDSDYGDGKQYPIYKQMVLNEGIDFDEVKWKPSIHMPRSASRITLEITNIRVERLNDISEQDCLKEGATGGHGCIPGYMYSATPVEHFHHTWDSVYGSSPNSWAVNPWVWVVEFEVVKGGAL